MADASGYSDPVLTEPGRAPSRVRIESAWDEPVSTWTVAQVRCALDAHEQGDFALSSALADQLLRDPIIAGDLEIRCRALASRSALPFRVEPGAGDGRKREAARKRCEDLWWSTCPETTIYSVQRSAILMGLSVGRVSWARTKSDWRPRLRHLPTHGLSYSAYEGWIYTSRDGQRHSVTPGDGTWFLFLPNGDRSWLGGAVRRLGEIWLQRVYARRDWARFSERHGMPVLAISEPSSERDDVEGSGGADGARTKAFYRRLRASMGRDAVLRLPQGATKDDVGWSAEWLELVGEGDRTFLSQLNKLEAEIHYALLGKDPVGGAKGGDGELASERRHSEFLGSDAETLSTTIRDQVWKPDVAFNIDPNDLELAGWGRWDTRPAPDLERRATTLDKAADAVTKLHAAGVDCLPVLAEFGLTAPGGIKDPPKPVVAPAEAEKPSNPSEPEEKS